MDNVNKVDHSGNTALHFAAIHNAIEVALELVAKAKVDARNKEGDTPLHLAARWNNYKVAKVLLDSGAGVNTVNDRGETPLHVAAKWTAVDVFKTLLNYGADFSVPDVQGKTPTQVLCYSSSCRPRDREVFYKVLYQSVLQRAKAWLALISKSIPLRPKLDPSPEMCHH